MEIERVYSARKVHHRRRKEAFPRHEPNRPSTLSNRENFSSGETRGERRGRAFCQSYLATPRGSRRTNSCLSAPIASSLTGSADASSRSRATRKKLDSSRSAHLVARPAYDATSAAPMRDLSKCSSIGRR